MTGGDDGYRGNGHRRDEDPLDEEFPLGDGTAETESVVYCPHCGEPNEIALDP
jgi:hypothetical protein